MIYFSKVRFSKINQQTHKRVPLIACGHFERSVLTKSLLEILERLGLIYMNIESINIFCWIVVKKRTVEGACAYFSDQETHKETELTDFLSEFLSFFATDSLSRTSRTCFT